MLGDFYKRKLLLANARKAISEDEWYKYLEKNYPDWWNSLYHNKWRINIIYYDTNGSSIHPMYINKNYTMDQIMIHFNKILINQRLALDMCFGKDISILELSEMLKNIIDYKGKIEFDKTKPDGTKRKLLDNSLINTLRWKPRITLFNGLKSTYKNFKLFYENK